MIFIYYNINETMSHNCLLNFIIGNRGCGKSYAWKVKCIHDFIEKGEQAIWMRRFDNEFDDFNNTFLTDIQDLFVEKMYYKSHTLYVNDKPCIFFQALSIAHKKKSNSYKNVTKVIYDEFLIENANYSYLKDEPKLLLSFLDTVIRTRENFKGCYMLANSTSMINPYFIYFKLIRDLDSKNCYKKDDILLQILYNEEFTNTRKQTRFGKLIEGTEYGDYSLDNNFILDNNILVKDLNLKDFKYMYNIVLDITMSVWKNEKCYYISDKVDENAKIKITTNSKYLDENTTLVKGNDYYLYSVLIQRLKKGEVFFSNIKVKNIFMDNIKL